MWYKLQDGASKELCAEGTSISRRKPYREEVEWLDPEGGSAFAFLTCSRKWEAFGSSRKDLICSLGC